MRAIRRVVFDTSTLVGAMLCPDSIPHRAFGRALDAMEVCVSPATLAELKRVAQRHKFDRYQPAGVRSAFVSFVGRHAHGFAVPADAETAVDPACRDPQDNKFLALVAFCEADALVSSDADLLALHPWHEVPILTPAAFLALATGGEVE